MGSWSSKAPEHEREFGLSRRKDARSLQTPTTTCSSAATMSRPCSILARRRLPCAVLPSWSGAARTLRSQPSALLSPASRYASSAPPRQSSSSSSSAPQASTVERLRASGVGFWLLGGGVLGLVFSLGGIVMHQNLERSGQLQPVGSRSPYAAAAQGAGAYPPAFGSREAYLFAIEDLRSEFGKLGREREVSTDPADLEDHGISEFPPCVPFRCASLMWVWDRRLELSRGASTECRRLGEEVSIKRSAQPHSRPCLTERSHGSTGDVQKVVQIANHYRVPVTPFSGGTSLEGHFSSVRLSRSPF
jgi:hypothetical protein